MRILGIDTSGTVAAAALYDSEADVFLGQQLVYTKRTHSQVILPLVQRVLADTGLTLADVDRFAVAAGPGSYTGLRIGVAAVKAMAFALGKDCCGVSTLEALCRQAYLCGAQVICAVMKARQGLSYAGIYRCTKDGVEVLLADSLLQNDSLAAQVRSLGNVVMTGDGAAAFLEEYPLVQAVLAPASVRLQNGIGLCYAALTQEILTPEELEAKYLQLVKAEKDRLDNEQK